jgi:ubiquinone/menaquinone biosynthesis C-methylase UbiE
MHEVREFYDELASDYHLIYEDWWSSVERQGRALNALIESRPGPGPKRVLDCTCGIGTQALGLSLHGHHLLARI